MKEKNINSLSNEEKQEIIYEIIKLFKKIEYNEVIKKSSYTVNFHNLLKKINEESICEKK